MIRPACDGFNADIQSDVWATHRIVRAWELVDPIPADLGKFGPGGFALLDKPAVAHGVHRATARLRT
jgi:hypothetical protein